MEEAEALSNKLAIQVAGNLKAIGTLQDIRRNFGSGYEVEFNILNPKKEEI